MIAAAGVLSAAGLPRPSTPLGEMVAAAVAAADSAPSSDATTAVLLSLHLSVPLLSYPTRDGCHCFGEEGFSLAQRTAVVLRRVGRIWHEGKQEMGENDPG